MLGKIILLAVAAFVVSLATVGSKHHSDNYVEQMKKFYLHGYNLGNEKKELFKTDKSDTR